MAASRNLAHSARDASESMLLSSDSADEEPRVSLTGGRLRSAAMAAVAAVCLVSIGAAAARFMGLRKPDLLEQAPMQKTLVMQKSDEWRCQHYTDEQDDDWCKSAGVQNGFEYKFVGYDGPEAGLCADCWCCNRDVEEQHIKHVDGHRVQSTPEQKGKTTDHDSHADSKVADKKDEEDKEDNCDKKDKMDKNAKEDQKDKNDKHGKTDNEDKNNEKDKKDNNKVKEDNEDEKDNKEKKDEKEAAAPWQCHHYSDDQDDKWCQAAVNQSGYEYKWVGPEANLCGECWCCKRSLTPPKKCAKTGQDCRKNECCDQEGFQCYEQDSQGASCKSTCTEEGWSCKELGKRTPAATSDEGAGPGEICANVGRCKQEGYQCFQMSDYYSACKVTCNAKDWTCKEYGKRTPLPTTAGTKCAWGADVCSPLGCCVTEGLQCYERDEYWGSCMVGCNHTMDMGSGPEKWSCKKYGDRRKVELGCAWGNEECGATKLCCHPGFSCVQKDDRRAYCTKETDLPGWEGTILGGSKNEWPVQSVPAGSKKESGTSLYCFMAVLPGSGEEGLRWVAEGKNASIFACDAHDVFDSWQSARADSGAETDGATWDSVINTDVFVNVWEQVLKKGVYKMKDWTVKVDPDAVFFADRLRYKLQQLHAPKGWPIYIKNTLKEFGFLGACEVLSVEAVNKYSRYWHECFAVISAGSGEDGYLKGCMDMIGAGYMLELDVLMTPSHPGACTDPGRVTFHPRKDAGSWEQCYNEAVR